MYYLINYNKREVEACPQPPTYLEELLGCSRIWDCLVRKIFGYSSIETLEDFGRYILKRQQRIYRLFRLQKVDLDLRLTNIFKERCRKYYDHEFLDKNEVYQSIQQDLPSPKIHKHNDKLDENMEFGDLKAQYAETIKKVLMMKTP